MEDEKQQIIQNFTEESTDNSSNLMEKRIRYNWKYYNAPDASPELPSMEILANN